MKIKNYRCVACGNKDFYAESNNMHMGIYCSTCGKFYKWADKDEKNLLKKQSQRAIDHQLLLNFLEWYHEPFRGRDFIFTPYEDVVDMFLDMREKSEGKE